MTDQLKLKIGRRCPPANPIRQKVYRKMQCGDKLLRIYDSCGSRNRCGNEK